MKNTLRIILALFSVQLFSQQIENVDFTKGNALVDINPIKKEVVGNVTYAFNVLANTDSIFIDAQAMEFEMIQLDGKKVKSNNDQSKLIIYNRFKKGTSHELTFQYKASPKKCMYFIGWEHPEYQKQVWTQGQGKYTSNWLPSFDDTNEKVEFDLSITFDSGYEVIANGKLVEVSEENDKKTWRYDMQQPMSSYLVALAIGDYKKKTETSQSGIPIELYYYPWDEDKFEPTYRYTKQMFDFLEEEIGVPYPWQNYKQVPVKDFLYAGMENTTTTIFSDRYMIDSTAFVDQNYVNVNAHELAHQWFGDMVTAKSGEHHWLQEGFATYYAYLVEKELFGEDHFHWKLYQSAQQLIEMSKAGNGESVLNPKASSLTFYEKGAWVLHILRNQVGEATFKRSVKKYLEQFQFKNADTDDFIGIVEKESGKNLKRFIETWLVAKELPEDFDDFGKTLTASAITNTSMYKYLDGESKFITGLELFKLKQKEAPKSIGKDIGLTLDLFSDELVQETNPISNELVAAMVSEIKSVQNTIEKAVLYKKALETNDIEIRQALAKSVDTIPPALKREFETLLKDRSYNTIEAMIPKFWFAFPEDRVNLLETTRLTHGFNDKNIRILWLLLALVAEEYKPHLTGQFYKELSGYTSQRYNYEMRLNAFRALFQLQAFTDENLKDLLNASVHHNWRFYSASRDILEGLLESPVYKERITALKGQLPEKEQNYLIKKLEGE